MKAVYYYSHKQRFNQEYITYINDVEFTQVDYYEDDKKHPNKNNFEDSIVVLVVKNLPIDETDYEILGIRVPKMPKSKNRRNLNYQGPYTLYK